MKRGAEMSINVVIIAAICLLVLVILAVLLIKSGGKIDTATSCRALAGAQCSDDCSSLGEGYAQDLTRKCDAAGQKCCIQISAPQE
jgi:hypothetical protein